MRLIIAEKPSVAAELAKVVGSTKKEYGYYSGKDYLVSWCVGHLIELANPDAYDDELKKWSLDTLPIIPTTYKTQVSGNTVSQYKILKELMNRNDVTELIEATDAGREGELIFRLVYDKAGCKKPFKRLWISSMEEKSIRDGLSNMKNGSEYDNLYHAALCRQRADWLVGINMTRLYSKMYNKTLKAGRVQTPTINLIVKRQYEITNFIPQIYYTLIAEMDGNFKAYNRADDKTLAQTIAERCTGKTAIVKSVDKQEKKDNPAALYDLTTLQRDANRLLGYSAQQTLDYMQKLYDNKLATYPRTDSRYITADMEQSTRHLIDTLLSNNIYNSLITSDYNTEKVLMKRVVNDKKVTDHHAIIPTRSVTKEKIDTLPTGEKNILLLIAYRLLSATYASHTYTTTKALLDIEGDIFTATGKEIIEAGYKMIEEQLKAVIKSQDENEASSGNADNAILPAMAEGNTFTVQKVTAEEKKTQPPKPYTEDTLLSAMETAGKNIADEELKEAMKDGGLGTPATRAGIIENIIKSGYINREGKKLIPTETAFTFIDLVCEKIKEPEMTAEWEKQLSDIHKGNMSDTDFMDNITGFIRSFVNETKASYKPELISDAFNSSKESIGVCPKCGKKIVEYPKSYSCESGKNGCGFVIWKVIAKKAITITQVTKLLTKGKTDLIKGFKSKTDKSFDAFLILKEDNSIGFEFPNKK